MSALAPVALLFACFVSIAVLGTVLAALHDWVLARARR